jgi:hypothetical protein
MTMMRSYLILNIRDMNDLPLMERWLLQVHAAETISFLDPILERYCSYRAVPAPPGSEGFYPYNWRMTEHWWRQSPFGPGGMMDQGTLLHERWPKGYNDILGLPSGAARSHKWGGSVAGPHPPVFIFVPARPTHDFLGKNLTLDDGTILRWLTVHRYPEGVSVAEGDDWYLNVHAKEVCNQPGLKRFVSYTVAEPRTGPFVRVSELWYENAHAWRKAIIESPPQYTKPAWAKHDKYPFLEPAVDFINQFILEAPTDDFKRYLRPYVTTA